MSETNSPTAMDLFCGAGGMSLGLERAGYNVIAGVDYDDDAVKTYDENFDHDAYQYDLSEISPLQFSIETDISPSDVNVLGGGPPCQGFSRSNLERSVDDSRNNLVFRFAKFVSYYQPRVFIMENVRGIDSIDDGETIELLCDDFRDSGYTVDYQLLNAAEYGVPQKRKRYFFIGVRDDIDAEPTFPVPTHGDVDAQQSQQAVIADD